MTAKNAMVKLIRLAQITGGVVRTEQGGEERIDSAKLDALVDILEEIEPGEPVVVFGRFHADLDAVKEAAARNERRCFELSGRVNQLAEWSAGAGGNVLAVQIQAGGVGIDLTRARYSIYYSPTFSLGDYEQSLARVRSMPTPPA